jgi:hypothetical protein
MKLTGENQSTRGKILSQCHFVHHKSHMDWPRASAVGGRRLTAWDYYYYYSTAEGVDNGIKSKKMEAQKKIHD